MCEPRASGLQTDGRRSGWVCFWASRGDLWLAGRRVWRRLQFWALILEKRKSWTVEPLRVLINMIQSSRKMCIGSECSLIWRICSINRGAWFQWMSTSCISFIMAASTLAWWSLVSTSPWLFFCILVLRMNWKLSRVAEIKKNRNTPQLMCKSNLFHSLYSSIYIYIIV